MINNRITDKNKSVLVAVLKNRRDFDVLTKERWYRIPVSHLPARKFKYLAFYQPVSFGRRGKRILYYAKVLNYQIAKRKNLLPKEAGHPRAENFYLRVRVGKIKKLPHPVKNIMPRRVSFGFTALDILLKSKNILELYDIAPTEKILEEGLKRAGIKIIPQFNVRCGDKLFRLDFAIFCKKGSIAVECDNKKAHSGKIQRSKDKLKNTLLKQYGWRVLRFSESKIVSDLDDCILKIKKVAEKLGGD